MDINLSFYFYFRCIKFFTYILLILISFNGVAQEFADKEYYLVDSLVLEELSKPDKQLIDSCLKVFHKAMADTSKINALNIICGKMIHDDWSKYQFFQYDLIQKSFNSHPPAQIRKSLLTSLAGALNNIGYIHNHQGDIPLALKYYHKSLKIKEEIRDKKGMAASYNNIGLIHDNQGDILLALKYLHKSLKIDEEIRNKKGMATSYNNIGGIYEDKGTIPLALKYYHKSLKIQEEIGDKKGMATSYNNIGFTHYNQGDILLALKYYHKSVKIFEKTGDKSGMAHSYKNIGLIHHDQGDFPPALEYGFKSLTLAREIGSPKIINLTSILLSDIYEKQGKGMKALEMYKLSVTMRDSINNEATQKASVQQQAKYKYEKQKAIDDSQHEMKLLIEQEEKEKQQILTYATGAGLGLVGIFLIVVFNRLRVTRRQKLVIEEQKQEVMQQKEVVEEKNQEIFDSITYAKRIQSAILPPAKLVKKYLQESFILYKPKDIVSGDFYWLQHKDNKVLFAAADCTGHGVSGAMVSVVCNNGLNRSVREHGLSDPGEILDKTREIITQEFEKSDEDVKDGMDIALCSLEGNKLQYAGANNPLWIIRNGEIIETKADKQPIGQFDNPLPYTTHFFELEEGDSIYIFSDGYVDQFGGEKDKKFKTQAFRELLLSIQEKQMEEQKIIIDDAFETWKGSLEQVDDVCVIGVRV